MRVFDNRTEAGRELGAAVRERLAADGLLDGDARVVVLGIPRGGLPVGLEVARVLGAGFDVAVVRKLRSPHNPELGYGAVGSDGFVELDEPMVARLGISEEEIRREVEDRRAAVERRLRLYREVLPAADLRGAVVIVTDDGVATGGTARRACALARRAGAQRVVLAVPVGPASAEEDLRDLADDVVVLSTPGEFLAVGQAYRDFGQLSDEETLRVLGEAARHT